MEIDLNNYLDSLILKLNFENKIELNCDIYKGNWVRRLLSHLQLVNLKPKISPITNLNNGV